jgi:hypothetical protein
MKPLFPVGHTVATPGCLELLNTTGINPSTLIYRHIQGDFGDLCRDDIKANQDALKTGGRIFSSYHLTDWNDKIWIITEADRSITTLLLPEEY